MRGLDEKSENNLPLTVRLLCYYLLTPVEKCASSLWFPFRIWNLTLFPFLQEVFQGFFFFLLKAWHKKVAEALFELLSREKKPLCMDLTKITFFVSGHKNVTNLILVLKDLIQFWCIFTPFVRYRKNFNAIIKWWSRVCPIFLCPQTESQHLHPLCSEPFLHRWKTQTETNS